MILEETAHQGSVSLGLKSTPNNISMHLIFRLAPQSARAMLDLSFIHFEGDGIIHETPYRIIGMAFVVIARAFLAALAGVAVIILET